MLSRHCNDVKHLGNVVSKKDLIAGMYQTKAENMPGGRIFVSVSTKRVLTWSALGSIILLIARDIHFRHRRNG
jgi:hypothetical protein